MARLGSTGRAAATYLLLAGLQRGASLIILPFISHAMSPDEFGAASMLSAASLLLTAVIAAPLIQLVIRAAARGEENGPALLRIAGLYCYILLPISVALIAAGVALFVPEVLGVSGIIWGIELLAIGFQPAASVFALWVAQAKEDLPRFVMISSTSVGATAVSKIVLVVSFHQGVLGWVVSDLISAGVSTVVAICLVHLPRATIAAHHIRSFIRFTVPLIPHSAAIWALTSLSRPAMAAVSSLDQVGLLSFGLNLASVAGLILAEINRAALPRYSREIFRAPTHETLEPVRWQLIAAFLVPALVGLGVAVAGRWLFAPAFWPSFALTGVLLIGQAAYGLYLIPMNYLTQTAGRPKYSALASGAGAVLILAAILIIGRSYGAVGVAYATAVGYVAMTTVAMILVRALKLDIGWSSWRSCWPEVVCASLALVCSVVALATRAGSSVVWVLNGSCLVLVLAAVILTIRRRASDKV